MRAFLLCLALLLAVPAWAAGEDDERWIERYMQKRRAAPAVDDSGAGFSALRSHVGRAVVVRLVDGRVRRGRVQAVAEDHVTLANEVAGGSYVFSLPRTQVAKVQLSEGAP